MDLVNYTITVTTSNVHKSGTNSRIYITLYSDEHSTSEVRIDNSDDNFENSKTDVFNELLPDIGTVNKIRLRSDGSGDSPAWHPESVIIRNGKTGSEWTFLCKRWHGANEKLQHYYHVSA